MFISVIPVILLLLVIIIIIIMIKVTVLNLLYGIKSKLHYKEIRNACNHTLHNLLSFRLPPKNVGLMITIYKTIILPVVLYGCETCSQERTKIEGV
jgi:hypothetical protein